MRNSTNLENPITQYSPLKQALQPHLGVLPSTFGIAFKPTAAINVLCHFQRANGLAERR